MTTILLKRKWAYEEKAVAASGSMLPTPTSLSGKPHLPFAGKLNISPQSP
ncbi:MAG: hypothetical protein ABIN91_22220 [Mucilaginibacter sp.]